MKATLNLFVILYLSISIIAADPKWKTALANSTKDCDKLKNMSWKKSATDRALYQVMADWNEAVNQFSKAWTGKLGVKERRSPNKCNLNKDEEHTDKDLFAEFVNCLTGKLEDAVWSAWNDSKLGEAKAWQVAQNLSAATTLINSASRFRNGYWFGLIEGGTLTEGLGSTIKTANMMISTALKGLNDELKS